MAKEKWEIAYQIFHEIGAKNYSQKLKKLLGITQEQQDLSYQKILLQEKREALQRIAQKAIQIKELSPMIKKVLNHLLQVLGAQRVCFFYLSQRK